MNIYKASTIKRAITLTRYLTDQGYTVKNGRTQAKWRDGDGWNVSVDDEKGKWHDFVKNAGGDILDLCQLIEGANGFIEASRILGERYRITPDRKTLKPPKKTRGEILTEQGWTRTAVYPYQNEAGEEIYWVDRYERETDGKREKSFIQRSPNAENLDGVTRTIYNLPSVLKSPRVFIVEGEKDVETLRSLGLVGTTNSGGGKYWQADFARFFDGREVIIIPDNDEVGVEHARTVAGTLTGAKSVRIVPVSNLPKGDITDYITKEGGSLAGLLEKVTAASAPEVDPPEIAAAKVANKLPFKNYKTQKTDTGKTEKLPIGVNDMIRDMKTRFLDFPRRLGGVLFDYTRDTKRIEPILTKDALKAWVNGTSGLQSDFQPGGSFASWGELFERLHQTVTRYAGVSPVPWYPVRDDIFPTYPPLPPPDPTHRHFWEFLDFFAPATPADRTLMAAFFVAPLYYSKHCDRPGWLVDTADAQGSGKSSVVRKCAYLYNETPIGSDIKNINFDLTHIKKRIISSEGRSKRFVFFDNVVQTVQSSALADFITSASITGMAPYGRGEESRPNDLTWCITMNGAEMDTDMTTRFYTIKVRHYPTHIPDWKERVHNFLDTNRFQIFADMIDMLAAAPVRIRKGSRFAAFDSVVLSAVCRNDDEFAAADAAIRAASEVANTDADKGEEFIELLAAKIATAKNFDEALIPNTPIAISCTDIDRILRASSGSLRYMSSKHIRRLVKQGMIPRIDKDAERVAAGKRIMLYYPDGVEIRKDGHVTYQRFTLGQMGQSNELSEGTYSATIDRS